MRALVIGFVLILLSSLHCVAQQSGTASAYISQYANLQEQARGIMGGPADNSTAEQRLATVTLLHRLEESALEANSTRVTKVGRSEDKDLLLVRHACQALDLALSAFGSYASTNDRAVLAIARESQNTASRIADMFSKR